MSWVSIVCKNTPDTHRNLTSDEIFTRTFLKYTKTLGRSKRILRLAACGPKDASHVFSDSRLMLLALRFDFEQAFPLVDPKIMTIDFLCEVYEIENVKSLLIGHLPIHILRDNELISELEQRTGNHLLVQKCQHKLYEGSFVKLVESIIEYQVHDDYHLQCKIHRFIKSARFERDFLKTIMLVEKNPLDFTIDKAFIMSLENSEQLTRKYQDDYEYKPFYDRIKHDIEFYNQMCRIQLYSKSAYKKYLASLDRPLEFLGHLCIQGQFYKKITGLIFDYIDDFSYGIEIGISSLRQIAIHLGIHVVIHPKKEL